MSGLKEHKKTDHGKSILPQNQPRDQLLGAAYLWDLNVHIVENGEFSAAKLTGLPLSPCNQDNGCWPDHTTSSGGGKRPRGTYCANKKFNLASPD